MYLHRGLVLMSKVVIHRCSILYVLKISAKLLQEKYSILSEILVPSLGFYQIKIQTTTKTSYDAFALV